jgi:hypothetical protein
MRTPSGDHSIPPGASAVKLGSVKIAEIVRGFVWACRRAAGVDERRMQRAKERKQEQEGTKTNSDNR